MKNSSKKIKVCILTSAHHVFDDRIFYKEARTLVKAGYDVTLIAQHNKPETVEGIKIIPLPKPKNRTQRFFKTDFLLFKKALQQKGDIYHFHDPELMPVGLFLKLLMKAKVIYDVHEDVPKSVLSKYWIPQYFRELIALAINTFEKMIARNFNIIIVVTPDIGKKFTQKKTIIIRNMPILSIINKVKPKKLDKKKPSIIYSGGITKIRGIKEIISSIHLLNGKVELWLLGSFSPIDLEKEILTDLDKDYIKYKGHLPFEEMYSYMKVSDIGIVMFLPEPNHITALPNKIFEYMAAGLPIVASNFSLWKEIIEGNHCGICVNPLDPKEIARAIEYLIEHPEEAKKMGENGRKAVLEKYNWENESKKLLDVYKGLSG